MSDIQPGDVVVSLGPDAICDACIAEGITSAGSLRLSTGRYARVAGITDEPWCPGLIFSFDSHLCYSSCCFRKIRPADEQFIQQIRAIKPVREDA